MTQVGETAVTNEMEYTFKLQEAGSRGFHKLLAARQMNEQLRYFLDDQYLPPSGEPLPASIADLLDIASSVSYADRKGKRTRRYGGKYTPSLGWMRHFNLEIGVREPDLWNDTAVKNVLEALLSWLTEDTWHLTFFKQPKEIRRPSDAQVTLPFQPVSGVVMLFSGGLDSLAGFAAYQAQFPQQQIYLMSAVNDRLTTSSRLYQEIHAHIPNTQFVPFPFEMAHQERHGHHGDDKSQRVRGFLFLSFAVATAVASHSHQILIAENGVGALNLPVNWCQLGTQNTRAVHPRTLVEMMSLVKAIGVADVQFRLPFLWQTKGEMCRELASSSLRSLSRHTVSCDNFPSRTKRRTPDIEIHCGICTSCLLRRQSIAVAGLQTEDAVALRYEVDLCQPLKGLDLTHHEHLQFMLDQVASVQVALDSTDPQTAMLTTFPELITAARAIAQYPQMFGCSTTTDIMQRLCDLYGRYAAEWQHFPYTLTHV